MDSVDDETANMAELMGFSSFGGPDRPTKKRRYNPGADAAIETTGSNSTPLGVREEKPEDGNADQIDLEDEEEEDEKVRRESAPSRPKEGESLLNAPPATLPQRPAASVPYPQHRDQGGGIPDSAKNHNQGGHQSKKPWYEGYYDNLSNTNPWAELEKKMSLEPLGSWTVLQQEETS